jgi:hypothetical protein
MLTKNGEKKYRNPSQEEAQTQILGGTSVVEVEQEEWMERRWWRRRTQT